MIENVIDQLVVPKLTAHVFEWSSSSISRGKSSRGGFTHSLASVVLPWLEVLQERGHDVLDAAKVRIGEMMKRWSVKDAIPDEWALWKDVFSRGKWDTLMLVNIVPKLAAHLDAEFEVNPRDQKMEPLDRVLQWTRLLRTSTLTQILEQKFFPLWLDTLHFWLIQPRYGADEVATWYHVWKDHFSRFTTPKGLKLSEVKAVEHGFRAGLKLMEDAMAYGDHAPTRLAKPVFRPLTVTGAAAHEKTGKTSSRKTAAAHSHPSLDSTEPDITFKSIAEKFAAEHNLLFIPTGKSHVSSGAPLFKVSQRLDGPGVTIYVAQDAVYAQMPDGAFRAVFLEDMVKMAGGA